MSDTQAEVEEGRVDEIHEYVDTCRRLDADEVFWQAYLEARFIRSIRADERQKMLDEFPRTMGCVLNHGPEQAAAVSALVEAARPIYRAAVAVAESDFSDDDALLIQWPGYSIRGHEWRTFVAALIPFLPTEEVKP